MSSTLSNPSIYVLYIVKILSNRFDRHQSNLNRVKTIQICDEIDSFQMSRRLPFTIKIILKQRSFLPSRTFSYDLSIQTVILGLIADLFR